MLILAYLVVCCKTPLEIKTKVENLEKSVQEVQVNKRIHSTSSTFLWTLALFHRAVMTYSLCHACPLGVTMQAVAISKPVFFKPHLLVFSVIETPDPPRFERGRYYLLFL